MSHSHAWTPLFPSQTSERRRVRVVLDGIMREIRMPRDFSDTQRATLIQGVGVLHAMVTLAGSRPDAVAAADELLLTFCRAVVVAPARVIEPLTRAQKLQLVHRWLTEACRHAE